MNRIARGNIFLFLMNYEKPGKHRARIPVSIPKRSIREATSRRVKRKEQKTVCSPQREDPEKTTEQNNEDGTVVVHKKECLK